MHSHAGHAHNRSSGTDQTSSKLTWALLLTLSFAAIEAATGWWANSLALMGDAGHMLTDAGALGLAAVAALVARRPATKRLTYGMGRVEIIAAIVNVLFMLAVVAGIVYAALQRLQEPAAVNGLPVIIVAALGLILNIVLLKILSHGHGDLNTRGAALHVLGDLLGSVAALASGLVIWLTGWTPIDPILSVLICLLILVASIRLLGQALRVVMEGVPPHLDLDDIGMQLASIEGVHQVHDLHVWNLSSNKVALSAHVVLRDMRQWPALLERLNTTLREQFQIDHTTLQPEAPEAVAVPMPTPNSRAPKT